MKSQKQLCEAVDRHLGIGSHARAGSTVVINRNSANLVKIGRAYHRIDGLSHAVAIWTDFRDRMMNEGLGSSDAPSVTACVDNKLYRISWNGRVWDGGTGAEVIP
jgi:hypothetical protein